MPRSNEVIRQWNILRDLEASRRETIDGLARKTNVTTRTIRRDLIALQTAGFPIYDEVIDGKRFWKLDTKPFRDLFPGFSLPELYALYFSRALLKCLAGAPFQKDLTTAFAKLEAVLPPNTRKFFDQLPTVLQARTGRRRGGNEIDKTIEGLVTATLGQRQATMRYHSLSSKRTKNYLVEPYRLLHFQGGFYLFAYVPEYNEMRTFAVERIQHLSLLETTFEPSQELSSELFAHSLGMMQGPPQHIEVEFTAERAPYVREVEWHTSQQVADQPNGSLRLSLEVCIDQPLRNWILGFGASARVLAPSDLVAEIAAELKRARAGYKTSSSKR